MLNEMTGDLELYKEDEREETREKIEEIYNTYGFITLPRFNKIQNGYYRLLFFRNVLYC